MNRRGFLTKGAQALGLAFIAQQIGNTVAWAAAKLNFIDMSNPNGPMVKQAKALNYVPDFKKAFKAGKIKPNPKASNPSSLKPEEQRCSNCMFYGQTQPEVCTLLMGVKVHKEGWCNSWSGKPKA